MSSNSQSWDGTGGQWHEQPGASGPPWGDPQSAARPGQPGAAGPPPGYSPSLPQQQSWGPSATSMPRMQVQARNPLLYALASALIAGLGTMLGGRVGRGIVILFTVIFLGTVMWIPFIGWVLVPVWLASWAFSIYDGYSTARAWNTRHGIIS